MLNDLRYRRALRRLRKRNRPAQKAISAAFAAYMARVAQHKPQDETDEIDDSVMAANETALKLEHEELYLQTQYLTFLDQKYLIPIPKRTDSTKWLTLSNDYR